MGLRLIGGDQVQSDVRPVFVITLQWGSACLAEIRFEFALICARQKCCNGAPPVWRRSDAAKRASSGRVCRCNGAPPVWRRSDGTRKRSYPCCRCNGAPPDWRRSGAHTLSAILMCDGCNGAPPDGRRSGLARFPSSDLRRRCRAREVQACVFGELDSTALWRCQCAFDLGASAAGGSGIGSTARNCHSTIGPLPGCVYAIWHRCRLKECGRGRFAWEDRTNHTPGRTGLWLLATPREYPTRAVGKDR